MHSICVQQGNLVAVHSKLPSEVIVGLGGFKNMYPLVHFITSSNLLEVGRSKPGQLLSMILVILNSLLHEEPIHLKNLVKKRNLFDLIKYCLYKINKHNMITQELI